MLLLTIIRLKSGKVKWKDEKKIKIIDFSSPWICLRGKGTTYFVNIVFFL